MSVREDEERRKTSTGRGLGIAAAAIGVGVGAALYYMFAKRTEDEQGQGTSNNEHHFPHEQVEQAFRQRSWSLEECSICCEIMLKDQELLSLPCSHNFHAACVTPWLNEHQTCPNCRKAA